MKQQLQKVQDAAAGFVLNEYPNINDVINIKWLPIEERIEYSLAVMGFKAICDEHVPNHFKLTQKGSWYPRFTKPQERNFNQR